MKEANLEQLEYIIGQMRSLQEQYPKAKVVYDFEERRVLITFPLPEDFVKIKDIKFQGSWRE
jgi:hypothetical protein